MEEYCWLSCCTKINEYIFRIIKAWVAAPTVDFYEFCLVKFHTLPKLCLAFKKFRGWSLYKIWIPLLSREGRKNPISSSNRVFSWYLLKNTNYAFVFLICLRTNFGTTRNVFGRILGTWLLSGRNTISAGFVFFFKLDVRRQLYLH